MVLQEAQMSSLQAVKKKFAQSKFGEVSKIRLEHTGSNNNNNNNQANNAGI